MYIRKSIAIFLTSVGILAACFSIFAKSDFSKKPLEIEKSDSCNDSQDNWDVGFDAGFKSGWDSGWGRRGEAFPNFDDSSPLGLKGIKQLKVIISRSEGDDYDCVIRNYVESRLRAVGITVFENDFEGFNSANFVISYFTIKKDLETRVRISLCLHQDVLIPRGIENNKIMHYLVHICARLREQIWVHTSDPKSQIKEFLQEEMDSFINDWLKENPNHREITPKEA